MKRSIKITSALLVLVLLLAQVVCVNAASYGRPGISISMEQTDHYIKTVTAKISGTNVYYVTMKALAPNGSVVSSQATPVTVGTQVTVSMEVRPDKVDKVEVKVDYVTESGEYNGTWTASQKVGGNSYYNPSSSGSINRYDSDDYWDGIRGGSSSSSGSV